ncbi:MAG TPA: hypothetical protein VM734_17500 [Kofleriaceae bacterium]|jgi:hypothetical protein|nr:hypothetical protein [Kofleriaceae bacterium]
MHDPTWAWARTVWDEHFQPLRDAGYELERLDDAAAYWATHERELRDHFPPEVFFRLSALRTEHERDGQVRLAAACGGQPLTDFCVVRAGGQVVAQFSGEQKSPSLYRMWHTNVHRDHRRRGLYRMILRGTIGYTRALGFDAITSEHAPSNNPVIIAKLQAGFRIYSLELDPLAGVSLNLRYFHNPEHLAAYEFRCGLASLSPALVDQGMGAIATLREQLGKR